MKAVKLLPDIITRKSFVHNEHPNDLHPDSIDYITYWTEVEKRCTEGFWGLDGEAYRYMPPQLYFYINVCKIIDEDEETNSTREISPDLRDLEWIFGYDYLIARGFSGFKDSEFTCHPIIEKLEKGRPLKAKEKMRLENLKEVKIGNEYKKYKNPLEILHSTYETPQGLPMYECEALNELIVGTRSGGKSFFHGTCVAHEWYFFGKKRFSLKDKPSPVELLITASHSDKSSDLIEKVKLTMDYIQKEVGSYKDDMGLEEVFYPGYFHLESVGSTSPGSKLIQKYKKKVGNTWTTAGIGSVLDHKVITIENPAVASGKRLNVCLVEEVGLVTNILEFMGSAKNSMIRGSKFGSIIMIGTSGFVDKIEGFKTLMLNPKQYDILSFPDLFEGRDKDIARFVPAYYADNNFKDENGNTNLEMALEAIMEIREEIAKSGDSQALDLEMMNRPVIPSEMFMSRLGTKLPVHLLRERKTQLELGRLNEKIQSIGWLEYDKNKNVFWVPDDGRAIPITTYNLDKYRNNLRGAIVVYEHPPENIPKPTYKRSLYKVTYDPVKDDKGGTSLASILVHKGFPDRSWEGGLTDTIVAEWIGRLDRVNDMHEIAIKLALYYNAKILPETNIPDIVRYCEMKGMFNILQPTPMLAIGKVVANPSRKYDVGVDMSSVRLQEHCMQLLAQWYLNPIKKNEEEVLERNLDNIYSLRLLDESILYNGNGNYDHLRSAMLLALWLSQETEEPIKENTQDNRLKGLSEFLQKKKKDLNYEFYHNY